MASSLLRNARAISGTVSPATLRSVSAMRASGASAGWQQANSIRSRSSGSDETSSSRKAGAVAGSASAGRRAASARSRRMRSSALRHAVVVSHAPGRSGTPRRSQSTAAASTGSNRPQRRYDVLRQRSFAGALRPLGTWAATDSARAA